MSDLVDTGSILSFDPMHRHGQSSVAHMRFVPENFDRIPLNCSIARQESPPEFIPMPVFQPKNSVVNDDLELASMILHGVMEIIQRELQTLRVKQMARNATSTPTSVALDVAMAMLGCKRSRVFELLEQGLLKRAPKVGRSVMITVASIDALAAEGLPLKSVKQSRRPKQKSKTVSKDRTRKHEGAASDARQILGVAIRKLAI